MQSTQESTHAQNADTRDGPHAMECHRSTSTPPRSESIQEKTFNDPPPAIPPKFKRGLRFWCIIAGLSVTSLQSSLENSVVVTAGPAIVRDLAMGEEYIWITNAFFLCCAAVQPLYGQLCNIFGRRWLMLGATALFTLGSGICGGATSSGMLIAGRGIQGAGSGGMVMISGIIIGDLVPMRQRGYYLGIVMISYTVGMTAGPIVGGAIVDSGSWRWVFYLNLPIGGVALVVLFLYLHVNYDKEMKLSEKIKRVDYIGNGLLESTVSEIRHMYEEALHVIFLVAVGIGCLACVLFLCQADVPLRQHLETKYGLVEESGETRLKKNTKGEAKVEHIDTSGRKHELLGGEQGKVDLKEGVVEV